MGSCDQAEMIIGRLAHWKEMTLGSCLGCGSNEDPGMSRFVGLAQCTTCFVFPRREAPCEAKFELVWDSILAPRACVPALTVAARTEEARRLDASVRGEGRRTSWWRASRAAAPPA